MLCYVILYNPLRFRPGGSVAGGRLRICGGPQGTLVDHTGDPQGS